MKITLQALRGEGLKLQKSELEVFFFFSPGLMFHEGDSSFKGQAFGGVISKSTTIEAGRHQSTCMFFLFFSFCFVERSQLGREEGSISGLVGSSFSRFGKLRLWSNDQIEVKRNAVN